MNVLPTTMSPSKRQKLDTPTPLTVPAAGVAPSAQSPDAATATTTSTCNATGTAKADTCTAIPRFNNPAKADTVLHLLVNSSYTSAADGAQQNPEFLDVHVHSAALRRSLYFAALLSGRWNLPSSTSSPILTFTVPSSRAEARAYVILLCLLHTLDFPSAIRSAADSLSLHLLFDLGIRACVRFLEAVPWTRKQESGVLAIVPTLPRGVSANLIARVSPPPAGAQNARRDMLSNLVGSAVTRTDRVRGFLENLLKAQPARYSVRKVLVEAFGTAALALKKSLTGNARPDKRISLTPMQLVAKGTLSSAIDNAAHLHWLVRMMAEMQMATKVVEGWSKVSWLVDILPKELLPCGHKDEKALSELLLFVMRCTLLLASQVASGSTLATRQVRMGLIKVWLPLLNAYRSLETVCACVLKGVCRELEVTFLHIISTLPVTDAQELLQECLGVADYDDGSPRYLTALEDWFRRAELPPLSDNS